MIGPRGYDFDPVRQAVADTDFDVSAARRWATAFGRTQASPRDLSTYESLDPQFPAPQSHDGGEDFRPDVTVDVVRADRKDDYLGIDRLQEVCQGAPLDSPELADRRIVGGPSPVVGKLQDIRPQPVACVSKSMEKAGHAS